MSDKSRTMRISLDESSGEREKEPPPTSPAPPVNPVKVVPRPTIGIQGKEEFVEIDLGDYSDSGLSLNVTDAGAQEITIADVGNMMKEAAAAEVDLDVQWDIPGDEGMIGRVE